MQSGLFEALQKDFDSRVERLKENIEHYRHYESYKILQQLDIASPLGIWAIFERWKPVRMWTLEGIENLMEFVIGYDKHGYFKIAQLPEENPCAKNLMAEKGKLDEYYANRPFKPFIVSADPDDDEMSIDELRDAAQFYIDEYAVVSERCSRPKRTVAQQRAADASWRACQEIEKARIHRSLP